MKWSGSPPATKQCVASTLPIRRPLRVVTGRPTAQPFAFAVEMLDQEVAE
jgi:hypothetical protein